MKRLAIAAIGLALVAALAAHGADVRAQPVASIALPDPGTTKQLYPGCNNIALTFTNGTSSENVVGAVTPAGVVESMWRYDGAEGRWRGYSPAFPDVSELRAVNFLDAVWLCVAGGPAVPTATAVPPPAPTPQSLAHYEGECFSFDYPSDWHLTKSDCADPHPCEVESVTVGRLSAPGCPTSWDLEAGDLRILLSAYGLFPHGLCEDAQTFLDVEIDGVNTTVGFTPRDEWRPALACTDAGEEGTDFHIIAGSAEADPDWAFFWNWLASLELRDCAPRCWCDGFC